MPQATARAGRTKEIGVSTRAKCTIFSCLVLATAVFVAFWPTFGNGFVRYDDQDYVTENLQVQQGLSRATLVWAFTGERHANWHPLTWLSHAVDCKIFGLNPVGHHTVNVILHALNSLLLFLLFSFLTGATWRSLFVAGLFALHPLHVESVAWISERKDLLSGMFFFLSLGAYGHYAMLKKQQELPNDAVRGWPKRFALLIGAYSLTLFFFALGLMSKPMIVTLPFVLLLLDWWPLDRWRPGVGWLRAAFRLAAEKVPFFIMSAAVSALTILVQNKARLFFIDLPLEARLANAAVACARYLGKTLWPSNLVVLYPHPGHWPAWAVAGATTAIAFASVLVIWRARKEPFYLVGWFWFLGMLVPVLGFVQVGVQSMADRYTYLPLVGLFVAFSWGAAEVICRQQLPRTIAAVTASVILGVCLVRTNLQTRIWRDTETLFTHAAARSQNNWVAHYNLALLALARYQEAHRGSIAAQVTSATTGSTIPAKSDHDYLAEIVQHCRAALEARPRFADAHATLAKALTEQGMLEDAKKHLYTAASLDPRNAEVRQNIAEVCYRLGNVRQAIVEYRSTLQLRADWAPVLNNLAWILSTHPNDELRSGAEAVKYAERACSLSSRTNLWFLNTLAAAYAEQGDFDKALDAAEAAHELALLAGDKAVIGKTKSRLELFSSGKPIRSP